MQGRCHFGAVDSLTSLDKGKATPWSLEPYHDGLEYQCRVGLGKELLTLYGCITHPTSYCLNAFIAFPFQFSVKNPEVDHKFSNFKTSLQLRKLTFTSVLEHQI